MTLVPLLLAALIFIPLFALCLRLSARQLGNAQTSWRLGLVVGALAMLVGVGITGARALLPASLPMGALALTSLLLQWLAGSWVIGRQARRTDDQTLGLPRGLLAFGLAYFFVTAILVACSVPIMLLAFWMGWAR